MINFNIGQVCILSVFQNEKTLYIRKNINETTKGSMKLCYVVLDIIFNFVMNGSIGIIGITYAILARVN